MALRQAELVQLSLLGLRDSKDPSSADPRKGHVMLNVYPSDVFIGAATVGRPGFQQSGTQVTAASIQGIYQFTTLDGTERTICFANGQLFKFNWSTRAWTNIPITGGVTLNTTGPIDAITFANVLVVSDGTHTPFQWDGASTFTSLSNCPVLTGPMTVYYGSLFGILASNPTTMVWSEVNDPTTGYNTAPFQNLWQLFENSQDPLTRLVGTNSALYYWRARSTGAIAGQVSANFSTTGVTDAVSSTVGTTAPRAVVRYTATNRDGSVEQVFFLSADGNPFILTTGGGLKDASDDVRETVSTLPRSLLPQAIGVGDPLTEMVLLGVAEQSSTVPTLQIVLDTRTGNIGGLWKWGATVAMGLVKDGNLVPRIMHGTSTGNVYDHGDPNGTLWNDANATVDGGTLAITHQVQGSPLGFSLDWEKIFDRIDFSFRLDTLLTNCTISADTPYGTSASQTFSISGLSGGFSLWNVGLWDVAFWSSEQLEQHYAVGLGDRGRWHMPNLTHSTLNERFGLVGWSVVAFKDANDAGVP